MVERHQQGEQPRIAFGIFLYLGHLVRREGKICLRQQRTAGCQRQPCQFMMLVRDHGDTLADEQERRPVTQAFHKV